MSCAKRTFVGLSIVSVALLLAPTAFAQTEAAGTLVQDSFFRRAVPDGFYGLNSTFLSGNVAGDWRTDGLVEFELPAAPAGQQVQSATLDLFNNQLEWANRGNAEFGVMAVMFEWSELDDTWDTIGDEPDYGDTVYDVQEFLGVDPPHGDREDLFPEEWVSWDVTELVRAWYDGSIDNHGFAIVGMAVVDGSGDELFPQFYSLDYIDDESLHPALNITFGEGGDSPSLQAGDADQDLDFDQIDLVMVQVAAKYLTGQAATWGEGDWNGAPGGQQGSPPPGDNLFDQKDIIAALASGNYLNGPYAAVAPGGKIGDGQTSVVYYPATGEVAVDAPAGTELTSINIDSAAGIFTGEPAQNLGGSFDNDADNNIFKATFGSSFGSLSFGNVAQAGLSEDLLLADLTVVGSLAGGGDLGNVDLVYVSEPSTMLLGLSVAALLGLARRRVAS